MTTTDLYDIADYLKEVESSFSRNLPKTCLKGQINDLQKVIDKLIRTKAAVAGTKIKQQLSMIEHEAAALQNSIYCQLTGQNAIAAA